MTKQRRKIAVLRDSLYCSDRQKRDLKRLERAFWWRNLQVILVLLLMTAIIFSTLYLAMR